MAKHPVARLATLAVLLALGTPAVATAQGRQPASPAAGSDLDFLVAGRSYLIRFPDDRHPVQVKESGLTAQPTGPPASWHANYRIDSFVVRKLGRGSWALLEHPADPKAALDVISARGLLADKAKVAELEADPAKKDFLAGRRKAAAVELKTTQTWVNLAHAVSIADPPAEQRWDVKIEVSAP